MNLTGKGERSFAFKSLILSGLSCLLLILSWQSEHTAFLIFFAFIPFFYLLTIPVRTHNERWILYIISYLQLFIWIYVSLYWIRPVNRNSHFIITLLSSTFLFPSFILAFWFTSLKSNYKNSHLLILIAGWICIEILHDTGILGFPYLNLGHVLGNYPRIIQWYSISGSIGGTIWIFLVNYILFSGFRYISGKSFQRKKTIWISLSIIFIIFVPALLSLELYRKNSTEDHQVLEVIAVHTSADVYDYKYRVEPEVLLQEYLLLTQSSRDTSEYHIIFWPENALRGEIFYQNPDSSSIVQTIKSELCNNPKTLLVTGAIVDEKIENADTLSWSPGLLYNEKGKFYYRRYNAALFIRSGERTIIRTKKKLVPFSERIPPKKIFYPLTRLVPNLANLKFSAMEHENTVFTDNSKGIHISPVICYGITFSNFVAEENFRTGSNFLSVIMNESWMRDTKATRHFKLFSVCRAVENHRYLVKSSNEGISALINWKGNILQERTGKGGGVIKGKILPDSSLSFFGRFHLILTWTILIFCLLFILFQFISPERGRLKKDR